MLFKLEDDKDFFDLNPGAKIIPEFKDRSSNQMIFISLVADRESPLRTIPEDKRRVKAAEIAGYVGREKDGRYDKNHRNLVEGKVEFVEKAIVKYREL